MILVGAGVVWTFYNFLTRDIVSKYNGVTLTYYHMLTGTLFYTPLLLLDVSDPKPASLLAFNSIPTAQKAFSSRPTHPPKRERFIYCYNSLQPLGLLKPRYVVLEPKGPVNPDPVILIV